MREVLAIITTIYLIVIAWQDLKERKIYTFPCTMLNALWGIEIEMRLEMPWYVFLGYMAVCMALYALFTFRNIWGAGDSDLFLLFAVIFFSFAGETYTITSLCLEIMLFATALGSALVFAWIEAKVTRTKLNKNSAIAVAPGFAVVMIALIWKGVMGC
ncbi:MAG: hypothetical protein PHX08_06905 [Lachnospiraceae bacterium]|nr:hypothetical protein [Lachnospiraceae bacterium]